MAVPNLSLSTTISNNKFTARELAFISAYLANGGNASQAVVEAGYNSKAPEKYGGALLARDDIRQEILAKLQETEDQKTADRMS